ncbi:ArsR/SmtB family transcription factor [Halolamina litorea]|uniref:ArsR/SmtB family transcription factor n=1 Tax=Halolamina litorea TaxID=1515593 RepID=A0ABD6BVZ6_9EURY|nr:winged helix-turn-helix domain-containing protein [Halolamina litorea]
MNDPDGFDVAEAFSLLGDETRVAVLRTLAEAADEPLGFAELRERVGVEDSGRFNYHLGKLVDRFVRKDDEGYRLTYAGTRVVGAIHEGTYAAGEPLEPVRVGADCPACGDVLELSYAEERITVACRDCETVVTAFGFPPGALAGRDPEELPGVLARHVEALFVRLRAGLCSNCSGPVPPTFTVDEDGVGVEFDCERCHEHAHTSLESLLLSDPAVIAFHHDHGVDVRTDTPWALSWIRESTAERLDGEPARYAVSGQLGDERLRVVVDESLTVVETERSTA